MMKQKTLSPRLARCVLALVAGFAFSVTATARSHGTAFREVASHATTIPLDGASATVAFSPNGDGVRIIVQAIREAHKQILVQAYGFSQTDIIRALAYAHDRGIDVRVILDKTNETKQYSGATYLMNHQIPTYIDDTVAIAHNQSDGGRWGYRHHGQFQLHEGSTDS